MKLQLTQSDLAIDPAPKPREIVTDSPADFFRVCAQSDRGELVIESLSVGKLPGHYIFEVRWP